MMHKRIFALIILGLSQTLSYKINIVKVDNCQLPDRVFPVEIVNITILENMKFYDKLTGFYIVRDNDDTDRDVVVRLYKCTDKTELCRENIEEQFYSFTCEKYLKELGPWTVFSESMSGPHCSHPIGVFEFSESIFDPRVLEGHVTVEAKYKYYRMLIEFKLRSTNVLKENKNVDGIDLNSSLRACIVMEFEAFFDM